VSSLILSQWQTLYLSVSLSLSHISVSGVEPDPKSVMDPVPLPLFLSVPVPVSGAESDPKSVADPVPLPLPLSFSLSSCLWCRV
jgi:hypothetical protein